MQRGYIKIWRKLQDSFLYTDSEAVHLFLHLIFKANYERTEFMFNGRKMTLDRGQMLSGRKILSEETGIGQHKIYDLLRLFEIDKILVQQKTNKYTVITIQNYDQYQDRDNTGTTGVQQAYTSKESISINKNTTYIDTNHRFKPPTLEEVTTYIKEKGSPVDADAFFNHYAAANWFRGKTKIVNWKLCVATWERNMPQREATWKDKMLDEIMKKTSEVK